MTEEPVVPDGTYDLAADACERLGIPYPARVEFRHGEGLFLDGEYVGGKYTGDLTCRYGVRVTG